ncbi:MAG: GDP-mannose 4,6-dehydratase [Alphaproteobacteria bacterium]|nr:GDP-mannose 4,6-dehydratase [Alphaproteobacteria bacterium]
MTKNSHFWRDRRVLVTGSSGFLGGYVVAQLRASGASVVGLVRDLQPALDPARTRSRQPDFIVPGALEDFDTVMRAVSEYEVDTVFHLAAQPIVGIANRDPRGTFEANIRGTWNLLDACRLAKTVTRILVASSDKAYGVQTVLPYDEHMPLQGCHPYDVSKSCADLISHTYYKTYGLPVCVTRAANFYGGGDLNWNRIVPGTIRSVLQGERPVLRSDGTMVRDYIFVKDVADAYLHLAERMDDKALHGEAFNFSVEIKLTVLELTRLILKLMGREDLQPVILNQASGEIPEQYLSAAKARRVLNWSPRYGLEEGLRETIAWYREYLSERQVAAAE